MMGLSPYCLSLRRGVRVSLTRHYSPWAALSPEHVAESLTEESVCLSERSPGFADNIDPLLLVFLVVVGVGNLFLFLNTLRDQPEVEHTDEDQTK